LSFLVLLVAACAGAKGHAEADVAAAERAIAALPPEAMKVVPDQVTTLTDAVNQAKDHISKREYAPASEAVREVPAKAQLVADSLPARKAALSAALDTRALPPPDLIIRTSGEQRLSNFFLWEAAYAELYFTDVMWPDFGRDELLAALAAYGRRQRRFGRVAESVA